MSTRSPNPGASRRQFLRDGLRYTILGGLAAISGKLVAREAARPAGQVCVSAGLCRGCAVYEDCGLPQALSAKQALGHSPARST
ncbi:MAG: hypothetical protein ABSA47_08670 [Verrucomicrobiota bacterium]